MENENNIITADGNNTPMANFSHEFIKDGALVRVVEFVPTNEFIGRWSSILEDICCLPKEDGNPHYSLTTEVARDKDVFNKVPAEFKERKNKLLDELRAVFPPHDGFRLEDAYWEPGDMYMQCYEVKTIWDAKRMKFRNVHSSSVEDGNGLILNYTDFDCEPIFESMWNLLGAEQGKPYLLKYDPEKKKNGLRNRVGNTLYEVITSTFSQHANAKEGLFVTQNAGPNWYGGDYFTVFSVTEPK